MTSSEQRRPIRTKHCVSPILLVWMLISLYICLLNTAVLEVWHNQDDKQTATSGSGSGNGAIIDNATMNQLPILMFASEEHQKTMTLHNPDLDRWIAENNDTPGARFVQLLREYLHFSPDAEAGRILACEKRPASAWCFGGGQNYVHHHEPINSCAINCWVL